jgi:phosphonate transport system substrate-binding protein
VSRTGQDRVRRRSPESPEALLHGKVDAAEINSQTEASAIASHTFDPSKYTEIYKSQRSPTIRSAHLRLCRRPPGPRSRTGLLTLKASDFTSGKTSIATELDFTPPASGQAMITVTKAMYAQLFSLAEALNLSSSDL